MNNDSPEHKHKYKYTEVDFHACLLIHGWNNSVQYPTAYWTNVDQWFKAQWPDRWTVSAAVNTDSWNSLYARQMEFKLQYFSWLRGVINTRHDDGLAMYPR